MLNRHYKSFQQLWQTYLATESVADLAQRPERRVITAHQDIHIKLFYIRRRLVIGNCEEYVSNYFLDVTFPLPCLTGNNRGTLVMQNNARLPQGLLLRCSKTTTSESLIAQRIVLNEHVWAEVDRRRKPQRDNVHIEADGVHRWNKPKILNTKMQCQWGADVRQLLKQKVGTPANYNLF